MNLIEDAWLDALDASGQRERISPSQTTDSRWVACQPPRPDFRGAQAQWLIGLLQTAFAPQDEDEWLDRWHSPPDAATLQAAFQPWVDAFELQRDEGAAFLQDLAPTAEFRAVPISGLLIDRGADINLFFSPNQPIAGLCPACTATALFALQACAPSGGVGHRVSMRGGGPLTTLLQPPDSPDKPATLWQRLWLNVLPASEVFQPAARCKNKHRSAVLPWLAETRTSEKKDGQTTPEHCQPLQAYWGMPRRIRLDGATTREGTCDVCGQHSARLFTQYRTKNYGVNYSGWLHPLTPYNLDPKNKEAPWSVKGQRGGVGYRHWLALTFGDPAAHQPAQVVSHYLNQRWNRLKHSGVPRLWAFGYDLDNMKARCWYDSSLPVHAVADPLVFADAVRAMLAVADEASRQLRTSVKQAWARRPADLSDEPEVQQSFWRATEADFYGALRHLHAQADLQGVGMAAVQDAWLKTVRDRCLHLFEGWTEGQHNPGADLQRLVQARLDLAHWLEHAKPMKALRDRIQQQRKEAA